jgi:hypothetical protein
MLNEEERYLVRAYKTGQILQLVVPGHPVHATRPKARSVGVHERRDAFQMVRPLSRWGGDNCHLPAGFPGTTPFLYP